MMNQISLKGLLTRIAFVSFSGTGTFIANAQTITIPIETKQNAMVLQVSPEKYLETVYFGKKLSDKNEYSAIAGAYKYNLTTSGYNSAYTTSGSLNLLEPAISVTHADGNKSLDLKYVNHTTTKISDDISLVSITMRDSVYDFEVTLYYQTYFNENVTEQWSVIKHHEKHDVVLNKYASANLYLRAGSYWLKHFHGEWAKEMRPEDEQLYPRHKNARHKIGHARRSFSAAGFYGIA